MKFNKVNMFKLWLIRQCIVKPTYVLNVCGRYIGEYKKFGDIPSDVDEIVVYVKDITIKYRFLGIHLPNFPTTLTD